MFSAGRNKWWMMFAGPCSAWNCIDDGFCQFWMSGWFCCILHGLLVSTVVLGLKLESMILEIFSNLSYSMNL